MRVTQRAWTRYIAALRKINDRAAADMQAYLRAYGLPATRAEQDRLIDAAFAIATKYGAASATLSAQWYDAVAALSGKIIDPALPAATPTIHEVAKAVVGTSKTGNTEIISSSIGRLVKQTGVDTTMQNALRDGAEWAWIPQGDTCAFCITLASNGWQRASKKAIKGGHAEHIHANCDCTYQIRFDKTSSVAGYDPDKYKELYEYEHNPDGSIKMKDGEPVKRSGKPKDKINGMRQDFYAQNSEEINAQKRDAYEKRKELESSAAEEADV